MQHVHQLAFVLVDTLDLHIEQRRRVHHDIQVLGNKGGKALFVFQLGVVHRLVHLRIINMLFQLAELAEVGTPGLANIFIQHAGERRIRQRQPATWGHAVGHVGEAHREDSGKISKQRLHHQIRVQLGNTVDLLTHHHRQPRHTHATAV